MPIVPPGTELDDSGPADAELRKVIEQLERLGAQLVAVGHGRAPRSRRTAERFAAAWPASRPGDSPERTVATIADWPEDGASWLKAARRLTETDVDAWVICDTPRGWARMSARLAESTSWDPRRTVAFATLGTVPAVELAAGHVEGLRGATADGLLWYVHHTQLPGGAVMSVQTVCLGWHWTPYKYTRTAVDLDDQPVAALPAWLAELGRDALHAAYGPPAAHDAYEPDCALVNFYDEHARLGLHQDKDERSDAPVISFSLGQPCTFRFDRGGHRAAARAHQHHPPCDRTDVSLACGSPGPFRA